MGKKDLPTSPANERGKLLRLGCGKRCKAQCGIDEHSFHFGSGDAENSVNDSLVAVEEEILFLRWMLGEHQDLCFGPLCCGDNVTDLSTTVM